MNNRQVVATHDANEQLWWFAMADAQRWPATTLEGGELFRPAERWVLLESSAALRGEPARIIDDDAALAWLLTNGYAPPVELAECAERRQLR